MKHSITLILLTVSLDAAFAADEVDFRLLSSSQQGVVIEYLPRYDTALVEDGDRVFQRWSFEKAIQRDDALPGRPALSYRAFPLILPSAVDNTVEVLSAEYETIPEVLLEPVARMEGDGENVRRVYPVGEAYTLNAFTPSAVTEYRYTGVVRGYMTGEVRVNPIQYQAASRQLRKYTRIVFRVNFGQAAFRVRGGQDALMEDMAVNYSTARLWKAIPPEGTRVQYRSSVFKDGTWFRFSITESGMYKLTGAALLAAGVPANTDPRTIRMYSNGGAEPPDHPAAPYPDDVLEVPLLTSYASPTSLSSTDYFIFYGQGPGGWRYNPSGRTFHHTINLYSQVAYYWVTYGGPQSKQMSSASSLSDPSPVIATRVVGKVFREDERTNVQNSGRQWLGQSLSNGGAITYMFSLPGADLSQPVNFRISVGARSTASTSRFVITEHGNALADETIPATSGDEYGQYFSPYVVMRNVTSSAFLPEAQSQLRFGFTSSSSGIGYIDWVEILYARSLVADGDMLHFHSHDTSAVVQYAIGGFSQQSVRVFDVTKFDSVVHIVDPIVAGGECRFQIQTMQGNIRELYVVGENAYKTPGILQPFPNQDVHSDTAAVDLIIITHREFLPAAGRLKQHRERPGPDRLTVRIVDVEHIYNEFSGGYVSPVGIRNYLRYLNVPYSDNAPKYVLLLGDGDYDFRRINGRPNWIPVWATYESFAVMPLLSFATDDSLCTLANSPRVQLALGRLPVRSLAQANDVVDKIIEYETLTGADPWKLRTTFVADDGFQEGTTYAAQSETIAENYTPSLFEKQKIYAAAYPLVLTSVGRRRPSANQAIVDVVNKGTLLLNFIGHGNPRLWTHEQIFVRESDFPRLSNKGKYFLVIAATCNYSQYDHPDDQSGGEQLVTKRDAGAIATISASRPVFAGDNYNFVTVLYTYMFQPDSLGRVKKTRLGDFFYKTKQLRFDGSFDNDKKFLLLGDPSVRFGIPRRTVNVDSINGSPETTAALFRALDSASFTGYVRNENDNLPSTNFAGTSLVTVYDADRIVVINKPSEGFANFSHRSSGGVLFRGQGRIDNGRVASSFIVPKDIAYDTTRPGRISLYFWNDDGDGAGVTRNFRLGGTNPNAATDSTGPTIRLYIDSRNFRPGDLVSNNPLLIADLYDVHGINTSNIGIGRRLETWIDDQAESIDLSDYYQGELDSYQRGIIQYPLTGLSPGSHRIRLRAWDTYNNSSLSETNFDVGVSRGLRVHDVFNYPNPFTRSTTFTFRHNQLVPIDVEVKVYTVAGRLIGSLERRGVTDDFVTVMWDGRDRDGDEIANGVYVYKLIVRTQDGRFTSESLGKLSKVR